MKFIHYQLKTHDSNCLREWTSYFFQVSFDFTSVYTDEMFHSDRQRQTAYLMIDRGMFFGTPRSTNLPKQRLSRLLYSISRRLHDFIYSTSLGVDIALELED